MPDIDEIGVPILDMLELTKCEDDHLLIVEDDENTKKMTFRNLRSSLISDNEQPANFRIYSSHKVTKLINESIGGMNDTIGDIQGDIDEIKKTYATTKNLKDAIEEIDNKKLDKTEIDPIVQELENTRKKSELITGKDLAYGTEDEKIHLQHLGSDILDAMTGHTQVPIPSIPVGGWTGDDLANGSIGAIKLKKDYSYRGNYPEGNLNRLVETGLYEVASSVEGVPHYGDDMDETRLLEVLRYGKDGKYIIQRVYYKEYSDEIRPYFERKGLFDKLSILEFVAHFEVTDTNKVDSSVLGDHYNNRGTLTTEDLFTINVDGNYYCESTVKNLPTEDSYMVSIRTFADRKEYEAKKADITGSVVYSCYEYYDSVGVLQRTEWSNSANILKSKFDGKIFHIFGDGISYGLGSSDILKTSYSSILTNKYGYKIYNHALSDATAGNYGDDILKERSLLTQIDTSTGLSTDNEIYVLIFIGAEDYRNGTAPIGDNSYKNDTTFKGALNLAVEKILSKASNAKILFASPIYRSSTEPGDNLDCDTNLVNDKYLKGFADAISDIAKYNHIPCIDLFYECMINKYNAKVYLNTDGVYPSDKGHAMLAEKIHDAFSRFY